jgi:hypothetical protein
VTGKNEELCDRRGLSARKCTSTGDWIAVDLCICKISKETLDPVGDDLELELYCRVTGPGRVSQLTHYPATPIVSLSLPSPPSCLT